MIGVGVATVCAALAVTQFVHKRHHDSHGESDKDRADEEADTWGVPITARTRWSSRSMAEVNG
jgi:hypothetical protein